MALRSGLAKGGAVRSGVTASCRPVTSPFTASRRPLLASSSSATRPATVSVRASAVEAQAAPAEAAPSSRKHHPSLLTQAPPPLYAIVEVGGVQLFVEPGKWYVCNRLAAEPGSKIKFGRVLAVKKEGTLHVGRPFLESASIEADILEETRGPKVLAYKMKPKKHYRRMRGHRQDLTKFLVTAIDA